MKANIFRVQANNSVMWGYFYIGITNFMLAGKKLTDFTSSFSPHDFKKNDSKFLSYFKDKWNWENKLVKSNKILIKWNKKDWKLKKLSKYVSAFDYIDKIFIPLSARTGEVCIISHAAVVGAPVGIANAGFTILFSLATGIKEKLLETTRSKKKQHDKILIMAKTKLNSIEIFVSRVLIDMEIRHEEIYYNFERGRQIWEAERKCDKCKWEIIRNIRVYEIK